MTSENLTLTGPQRTVVAQAQDLIGLLREAADMADKHSWRACIAVLSAIHGDIERIIAVAHIVPANYQMTPRKDSP